MIRAAALGMALGATNIHPAGQLVEMGAQTWDQPGFTTFYRDPSIVVPSGPVVPAHPYDGRRGILDHVRRKQPRKALDLINHNNKQGPGRHDLWNSEVPN